MYICSTYDLYFFVRNILTFKISTKILQPCWRAGEPLRGEETKAVCTSDSSGVGMGLEMTIDDQASRNEISE